MLLRVFIQTSTFEKRFLTVGVLRGGRRRKKKNGAKEKEERERGREIFPSFMKAVNRGERGGVERERG